MATLYAKTAGGNWSAAGTWSNVNASGGDSSGPPTAADNVIFELLSGNVTVNTSCSCRSLDCTGGTGSYTGTLTWSSGAELSIGDGTSGAGNRALRLASGMTLSGGTSRNLRFKGSSGTAQTVTSSGKTIPVIVSQEGSGTTQLSDAMVISATGTSFANSSGSWDMNSQTMTLSGAGVTFSGRSQSYSGTVVFTGGGTISISGTNTFTNLTYTGTAAKTDILSLSADQTVTGTLTLTGNSVTNRLLVQSSTLGTACTITNSGATMTWSNVDFRDIALGTSFDASAITGKSGDCGGNTNITFTTPATQTATGTASFTWSTHGWTTRVPLPQDDVVINNTFTTGSVVTLDMPRAGKSIDWSGATWSGTAVDWAKSTTTEIYGSLTLKSGMTNSGTSNVTFAGRGAFTFTSAGVSWSNPIFVNSVTGSLTLQDALTSTRQINLTSGTVDFNGMNASLTQISTSNSNTRTLTLGSGTITLTSTATVFVATTSTGLTVTATSGTIKVTNTSASTITVDGGSKTYGTLWLSRGASTASITIAGSNTFTELKDTGTAAHSLLFTTGTTQTVGTFTATGSSGNVITINSTTTGTHSLVKTGGGTISCDWLNIQHSVATPATTWYAGTNSTNNQGVATAGSGWIFTAPPGGGGDVSATASDSVTLTELISKVLVVTASPQDSITASESVVTSRSISQSAEDTVSVLDSPSTLLSGFVATTDTVSIIDSASGLQVMFATSSDTVSLLDSVNADVTYLFVVIDTITVAESAIAAVLLMADLTETVVIGESTVSTRDISVTITDDLTVATTAVTGLDFPGWSVVDSITLSDATCEFLTWTIEDGNGSPLENVKVWLSFGSPYTVQNLVRDSIKYTNSSGQVNYYIEWDTTYYGWRQLDGYGFTDPWVFRYNTSMSRWESYSNGTWSLWNT